MSDVLRASSFCGVAQVSPIAAKEEISRDMKRVTALAILLLIPTVAFAKGECRDDIKKLCKDVRDDKGKLIACMDQHEAELSDACKARRDAKVKQ